MFILYNYWAGTACPSGIGKTNYRGIRLLNFARKRKITLANKLFPYKVSRETPQHAPNGKTHKQIDYIVTPQRFKSSINKTETRTFPGADNLSDNDMVLLAVRLDDI